MDFIIYGNRQRLDKFGLGYMVIRNERAAKSQMIYMSYSCYINKSMKYYLINLGKILALYLLLVVFAEIGSSAYTEYQISLFLMTPFDWKASLLGAVVSIGKRLVQFWLYEWKLVGLTLWVVKEKVYYPIIVLTTLALVSRIKEKSVERPEIPRSQRSSLDDFHKYVKEQTDRSVIQLKKSKAYKDYQKDKLRWQNLQQYAPVPAPAQQASQEDQMWKDVQKQIFSQ